MTMLSLVLAPSVERAAWETAVLSRSRPQRSSPATHSITDIPGKFPSGQGPIPFHNISTDAVFTAQLSRLVWRSLIHSSLYIFKMYVLFQIFVVPVNGLVGRKHKHKRTHTDTQGGKGIVIL